MNKDYEDKKIEDEDILDYSMSDDYSAPEITTIEKISKKSTKKPRVEHTPKTREEKRKEAKKRDHFFVARMFIMTLALSAIFSVITEAILSGGSLALSFIILIILILIGIVFDTIGVAATSCDIEPFIAKSTRKDKRAIVAMNLLKNSEQVSSFCNDVVGDICGVVSGGCAGAIVLVLATQGTSNQLILSVVVSSFISALTVGGKAIGKILAIRRSQKIISFVAGIVSVFRKK